LAQRLMAAGHSLAVLAVDPTSPLSGGAVLGDRVRFTPTPPAPGQKPAFFRSTATRGHQGGLAKATEEMCVLLEGFGYHRLLIESVGVGQVGLDIAAACDTTVVVVVPESGDDIQALKAGLLELADVLVVNKADRPGAQTLGHDLREAVHMRTQRQDRSWRPPVLLVNGLSGEGCAEVLAQVAAHHTHQLEAGGAEGMRRRRLRQVILNLLRESVQEALGDSLARGMLPDGRALEPLLDAVVSGGSTPFSLVRQTLRTLFARTGMEEDAAE
ncbi:MAG: methylmalonyl Co-A mutase-associated GTPase MeaB, partial [Deltaproteobacteria bacterium]|nr:methylmalonyl Co-A mutase-associated GTPase MeaB [Deltaproteobacteria bacterium]